LARYAKRRAAPDTLARVGAARYSCSFSAGQQRVHRRRLFLHVRQDVAVAIQHDRHCGMAQEFARHIGVHILQQSGTSPLLSFQIVR
jgi:hypothetical protein